MGCENYREKLSAYIDGELDYESRAKVEKHLLNCGECRGLLEGMRRVESFKPILEPPEVPQEKWRECWDEIKKQTTDSLTVESVQKGVAQRRRERNLRRAALAVAGIAAAVLVAVVLMWPAAPVVPEASGFENTVSVLDYDDANYSLYVIDKPEYTIIKLIPVDQGAGG